MLNWDLEVAEEFFLLSLADLTIWSSFKFISPFFSHVIQNLYSLFPPRRLYVIHSVNLEREGGEVELETKNTAADLDSCCFCY